MIDNKENDMCEQHNTEECASLEEEYAKMQAQLADMLDREARAKRALEAERASRLRQIDEEMARRNAAIEERIRLEMEAEFGERYKALDAREQKIDARKQRLDARSQMLDARKQELETRKQMLESRKQMLESRKQMLESHKQKLDARLEAIEKTGDVKSFEDLLNTCNEILDEVVEENNRRNV